MVDNIDRGIFMWVIQSLITMILKPIKFHNQIQINIIAYEIVLNIRQNLNGFNIAGEVHEVEY